MGTYLKIQKLMSTYRTIQSPSTAIYKEQGSRFIAHAYPVQNQIEIKNILSILQKEHPKARHICYAYRLSFLGNDYRANDDGEPAGSAGLPILGQIESLELHFILVAVVRYFGGTLLGMPGLIQSYKKASKEALSDAIIETKPILKKINIICDYDRLQEVYYQIKKTDSMIISQHLELKCAISIHIPSTHYQHFIDFFNNRKNIQVTGA